MRISKRAQEAPASPIRKLIPYANEAKKKGVKVYHLNIGQPDIETPEQMLNRVFNYKEKVIAYGPSDGLYEYKEWLVKYYNSYGLGINEKDVLVTTAGSEGIIFSFMAIMDPGDEVIIPEPFYANYNGFAAMANINIVPLTTYAEDGFALPPKEEIEKKITSRTRAFQICNPGNPTGKVYTRKEMEMITELANKYNLYVIADEVYREFVYDSGVKAVSILEMPGMEDKGIIVDSISKRYSACGARIGCIVSKNQEVMKSVMKFAQARLCPPTLEQVLALGAEDVPEEYFAEVKEEYKKRRDIVMSILHEEEEIIAETPGGAFYIIAKLPVKDAELFVEWMLTSYNDNGETTMAAPAAGFYATPNIGLDEVRIAYILNTKDLERAMNIFIKGLKHYMEKYPERKK